MDPYGIRVYGNYVLYQDFQSLLMLFVDSGKKIIKIFTVLQGFPQRMLLGP